MIVLDSLICAAICLRMIFFRRAGAVFRPFASATAYLIIIASGAVPLRALMCDLPPPSMADIGLHLVLCVAIFAARGNVVELFHTSAAENCIYRLIRRTPHEGISPWMRKR